MPDGTVVCIIFGCPCLFKSQKAGFVHLTTDHKADELIFVGIQGFELIGRAIAGKIQNIMTQQVAFEIHNLVIRFNKVRASWTQQFNTCLKMSGLEI